MIGTFNSGRSGRCAPADWHEQEEQEQDELCCWAVRIPPLAQMCCWFHMWLLVQVFINLQVDMLAARALVGCDGSSSRLVWCGQPSSKQRCRSCATHGPHGAAV